MSNPQSAPVDPLHPLCNFCNKPHIPNAETIAAIKEAEADLEKFDTISALFAEWEE